MSRWPRPAAAAAMACGLVAAGVGAGTLAAWQPEPPLPDARRFESEAVALGVASYDGSFTGTATIEWSEPVGVVAPRGLDGIVTASTCGEAPTVRSGDRLLDVDGVGRIAFHSDPPFHRALWEGDVGPDVAALRRLVGVSGTGAAFDRRLAGAVAVHNRRLAAGGGEVFDPATVIYLPADEVVVGSCVVAVGRAVTAGDVVFSIASRPIALRVSASGERGPLDAGPWVAEVGGSAVPVDPDGDRGFVTHDAAALAALGLGTDAPPELPVVVRLATPLASATVPASALVTSGTATCLAVGRPDRFSLRPVEVLDARLGVVQVTAPSGDEPLAGTVVTNAPLVAADRPCPSR